jgi:class 3 adenylate cyclase
MARLDARTRATLPDTAFAYIDARGRRKLPIHDAEHVRNALSRFDQVAFEDESARDRARTRLLRAAKKFGIVPVGFMDGQVRRERKRTYRQLRATATDVADLPSGVVTLMMTDIEGSTELLQDLGEAYGDLLSDARGALAEVVTKTRGWPVDARADDFFAVFKDAGDAVEGAATIQRALAQRTWPGDADVRMRIGLHTGRPKLTEVGYIGVAVHTVARICSAGHGGQIIVSAATKAAAEAAPGGFGFRSLGRHRLRGLRAETGLYQVEVDDLPGSFPPIRTEAGSSRQE